SSSSPAIAWPPPTAEMAAAACGWDCSIDSVLASTVRFPDTMRTDELQTAANEHLLLHFAKQRNDDLLVLERGEGPYVFDTGGNRYIDALSSLFCAQIGYSFGEEMAAAVAAQLTTLAFNTNWGTAHPPSIELAQRLAGLAPEGVTRVFFTSGGS